MEYLTQKEQKTIQETKDKDILKLSKKEYELRQITYDLDEMQQLAKDKPETIYTILRSVSNQGMSRLIDMFYVKDEKPIHIHFHTNRVFQKRVKTSNGFGYRVGGCGMDMGFHLVNSLSYSMSQFLGLKELDGYIYRHSWF
jgi:hypothetical protein